ncbi:polysaccharide lyase [Colwellia sp. 1_MG-2023]|uniref:polysaccharide lyase n=1 Tax=Colwellia sp. 1_MG-2023 TaxID=3062649 RepID=UPI0026E2448E|nr:polysaccharide lyase [Colwellia sp. 1_MG-2023]MDO6446418.1 polysaccharide lyase [Colwellia sp. 1_MG-2023]
MSNINKTFFYHLLIISIVFLAFAIFTNALANTPPIGLAPDKILYVDKNNPDAFHTIQAAINHSSEYKSVIVLIAPGYYKEKLFITRNNLSLVGSSAKSSIIAFDELRSNWRENHQSDWGAAVINIAGSDINIVNLTVINNYGRKHNTSEHQFAIRGFENATRITLHQCHMIADGADTVSLWNKKNGMYYHSYCTFEGYTDMVCPRGSALIENSTFINHKQSATLWHDGELDPQQKLVVKNSYFKGTPGYLLARHHYDAQFYLIDNHFSKEMADTAIFKKTYNDTSKNRANKYGSRYFFYNNQSENSYPWLKNNFVPDDNYLGHQTYEQWVFDNQWSPKQHLAIIEKAITETAFAFDGFSY